MKNLDLINIFNVSAVSHTVSPPPLLFVILLSCFLLPSLLLPSESSFQSNLDIVGQQEVASGLYLWFKIPDV